MIFVEYLNIVLTLCAITALYVFGLIRAQKSREKVAIELNHQISILSDVIKTTRDEVKKAWQLSEEVDRVADEMKGGAE